MAVIGPSGSGKSSLVRAGVLPRLRRLPDRWVVLPPLRPGERPVAALARALADALRAAGQHGERAVVQRRIEADSGAFVDWLGDLATGPDGQQRSTLVVVDQAEELVLHASADERVRFVELIQRALETLAPVWLLVTVRSEFLSASLHDEAQGLPPRVVDRAVIERIARLARHPDED